MTIKVLLLDDIFSSLFRNKFSTNQLVWNDNWVASIEDAFIASEKSTGISFELIKSGKIESWQEIIENEKPDILILDISWPEQAMEKYGDRLRAAEISLNILPEIRTAYPSLPVICHTAKPEKELIERAYKAGATFFVEKVGMSMPEVQVSLVYIIIYLLRQVQ
jgi:CheY-like chemotaxis protein